jgi:hypothetical protein
VATDVVNHKGVVSILLEHVVVEAAKPIVENQFLQGKVLLCWVSSEWQHDE